MKEVDCIDLYKDGKHYDLHNNDIVVDIPFYIDLIAKFGDPVLEIACGTGRVTIPIAEKGFNITGIDISDGMLKVAKEKAEKKGLNINWIKGDCRDFTLNNKYNTIFFPHNSITHIHDLESFEALCKSVKKVMNDNGIFIIDIFNPIFKYLTMKPDEKVKIYEYNDPDGSGKIEIYESSIYETDTQIKRTKWHYVYEDKREVVRENNIRIYFPQELDTLLKYNGFHIENKYGDYNFTQFNSNSEKQLIVCKKTL